MVTAVGLAAMSRFSKRAAGLTPGIECRGPRIPSRGALLCVGRLRYHLCCTGSPGLGPRRCNLMASMLRNGELVRGVFKILLPHPEGLPSRTVMSELPGIVPPTEFEVAPYANLPGVRRYEKTVRFATIAPVKAGWLVK